MTEEELSKIPFRMVSHLAMEHEHCATYVNDEYGISICNHTKRMENLGSEGLTPIICTKALSTKQRRNSLKHTTG